MSGVGNEKCMAKSERWAHPPTSKSNLTCKIPTSRNHKSHVNAWTPYMCECTFTERLFCHVWFSHGTSQDPTNCFCWKLSSRSVSVGLRSCYLAFRGATTCFYWLRNCHPARLQQPFKPLKPPSSFAMGLPRLHELFLLETAIWQCFCWLRSCYLAFATRYNLFLLGFETAIRHVSSSS